LGFITLALGITIESESSDDDGNESDLNEEIPGNSGNPGNPGNPGNSGIPGNPSLVIPNIGRRRSSIRNLSFQGFGNLD
jgi:hypothetical protein